MIRKAITVLLLAFVASSLLYLTYDELTRASGTGTPTARESNVPRKLIVYYFWEPPRCDTCMKFESYTQEVLRSEFAEELQSGLLEWRVVDVGEPEGEHFTEDYELFTKSIVLSDVRFGKERKWKNLEKIWDLVGDKVEFLKYIRGEVASALRGDR